MSDNTPTANMFSEAQVAAQVSAAVDKAVAETTTKMQAEIDELRRAATDSEMQAKIDEAVAELKAKLEETTAELVAKDAELKTERDERAAERAAADQVEQARLAAERRETRIEAVKATEALTDNFVESDAFQSAADRWASMSDEEFAAQLAEYQALRPAADTADPNEDPLKDQKVPAAGLTASAEETSAGKSAIQQLNERKRASFAGQTA